MKGSLKSAYECVKVFSETDFTEDMKKIDIPVLLLHGDDDQVVPFASSAELGAKLLKKGTLKVYPGGCHGLPNIHVDEANEDLLAFLKA